jgi:DNA-directed RNA polymerase specialized sigma24 family protein
MSASKDPQETCAGGGSCFTATHWSVVLAAGQGSSPKAQDALEKLCSTYWYPIHAFVRRQGYNEEGAKDLTQGYFACLLEKRYWERADQKRGKFRNFLLASLKHFLADEWDKSQAQKRGGGARVFSLDDDTAEDRYRLEPSNDVSPDKLFDRRWALTTLEQAANRLRKEYSDAGQGGLYAQLQDFLSGALGQTTYGEAAAGLGMSENTLKSYVHRLRLRNREILREVIAETVATPEQIDEELRELLAALA